jgi:hypothetical protein
MRLRRSELISFWAIVGGVPLVLAVFVTPLVDGGLLGQVGVLAILLGLPFVIGRYFVPVSCAARASDVTFHFLLRKVTLTPQNLALLAYSGAGPHPGIVIRRRWSLQFGVMPAMWDKSEALIATLSRLADAAPDRALRDPSRLRKLLHSS